MGSHTKLNEEDKDADGTSEDLDVTEVDHNIFSFNVLFIIMLSNVYLLRLKS